MKTQMELNLRKRISDYLSSLPPDLRADRQNQWETLIHKTDESLEGIVGHFLHGKKEDRLLACGILGALRCKQAVNDILNVFRNPGEDTEVRKASGIALATIRSKRTLKPLITILQEDKDAEIRESAAYVLGWLSDKSATETLIGTLVNRDEDTRVRSQAAEALGLIMDPKSIPPLITALDEPYPEIRFWATYALGEVTKWAVMDRLHRLCVTDFAEVPNWWSVSKEAGDAIKHIIGIDNTALTQLE
jgi:hypothetical protein